MVRCSIAQHNKQMLIDIQDGYGGSIYDKHHVCWHGTKAIEFLERIYPHLLLKKEQVDGVLTWWYSDKPRLREYGDWVDSNLRILKRDREQYKHGTWE